MNDTSVMMFDGQYASLINERPKQYVLVDYSSFHERARQPTAVPNARAPAIIPTIYNAFEGPSLAVQRMLNQNGFGHITPSPDALAYRIKEAYFMGGPGRTKIYELAKKRHLKLVRIYGRTLIEGDSLRKLLKHGN